MCTPATRRRKKKESRWECNLVLHTMSVLTQKSIQMWLWKWANGLSAWKVWKKRVVRDVAEPARDDFVAGE